MIGDWITDTIGVLIGAKLGDRWNARKRRKLQAEGRIYLSVRARGAGVRGVTSTWNPGLWTVSPQRISLYRLSVSVDRIVSVREATNREGWKFDGIDPRSAVLEVESGSGRVEIAVMADQLEWFTREVGVPCDD
ncbi:hypothetical protein ATJ88_3298 [Isoptericola jiangsuensis]|uniref:Uncharacterized protein n=1 Tax=Isoptericola jiangsuensis TaxID=548579 RepID=A0A2A9F227_9MICO|nr:hypothetical protein [Isoptericola jiangsuensis]PFG44570.1 hypothetical protein ATJ88_3298 [Isoptericola jiangsuensis]